MHVKRCPKTGRIVALHFGHGFGRFITLVTGLAALAWVIARVVSKPGRITYPCVRVAAPLATSLLTYVTSAGVVTALLHRAKGLAKRSQFALAAVAVMSGALVAFLGLRYSAEDAHAENVGAFTPTDAANAPIGVAHGIKPGRVTWAYDQTATNFAGTGSYADDANTDKVKVRSMLERTLCVLSDKPAIADAWASLFTYFNNAQGNGSAGYKAGEKIAIKINLNNNGGATAIDATPQTVHALLWELVNVVGAAQADISIYDTMRRSAMGRVKTACQTDFPSVHYNDGTTVSAITFSGGSITTKNVGTEVANAKYLINMALLKRHGRPDPNWVENMGNTAVTLTFKNHCGTVDNCSSLHYELRDWNQAFGSYNPLVDLMASSKVGKKTVLFLLDGLYSGNLWNSAPQKWQLTPFAGDYPSSLFASQDPVAIDSVGLDFLRSEWELLANADNYLHEAALIGAPPSGTVYKPDGTAVTQSLGAHEHWNNSTSKQYTRNLDPVNGKGIELVRAENYVFTGGTGGTSSTGGAAGTGGATALATGGASTAATGGRSTTGGASAAVTGGMATLATGGRVTTGGIAAAAGSTSLATGGNPAVASSGGASSASTGGTLALAAGGMQANGGASAAAGASVTAGTSAVTAGGGTQLAAAGSSSSGAASDTGSCSCRTARSSSSNVGALVALGLMLVLRRKLKSVALTEKR